MKQNPIPKPKPIPFTVMYTTLAGRFSETNDRFDESLLHEAISLAKKNRPPLWHGKLHGNGGEMLQVAVAWKSKRVWVGLDLDPEFEDWMSHLTALRRHRRPVSMATWYRA